VEIIEDDFHHPVPVNGTASDRQRRCQQLLTMLLLIIIMLPIQAIAAAPSAPHNAAADSRLLQPQLQLERAARRCLAAYHTYPMCIGYPSLTLCSGTAHVHAMHMHRLRSRVANCNAIASLAMLSS
jgi:hypothetical protein